MNTLLQPIETAPKDGTFIYLYGDSGYTTFPFRVKIGRWGEGYRDHWIDIASDSFEDDGGPPLFWTPIIKMELISWESAIAQLKRDQEALDLVNEGRPENQTEDQEWIFTFCGDHAHPNGYVVIKGTYGGARAAMFDRFKDKWGFQYPTRKKAGVYKYNLKEII